MKGRLFSKAIFKLRNVGVLIIALGLAAFVGDPGGLHGIVPVIPVVPDLIAIPSAVAVYLAFVIQTLNSKSFHESFNHQEKIRHIQDLNYLCLKLSNEAKRNTNTAYLQKLKKVMEDKSDIVDSFFKGEHNYLKEKIVEQTLNLVVSYLKLLNNFCIRSRELSGMDISEVAGRINTNSRKLSFTKDVHMMDDIKKIIEMDEKVINRIKDEKKELERISAKLDYMESTVNMFKHQVITSVESEEMLEKLETAVNEAEALDTVLEERRKNKLR